MDALVDPVRCPLLIGRDDLLELVDRRLDDVQGGRGQFLLVAGEAGIGKTRFLGAMDRKAAERGFVRAWANLAPQDQDVPAASILDLARTMLSTSRLEELGRGLLDLRDATVEADLGRRRHLVMDVIDRILTGIPEPTMLLFEDLQWADELSLEIIGELARRSRDRRLLLTGGYRTDETPVGTDLRSWRSRYLTQRIAEEIRLVPLDKAQTALVTTLILDTGLPAPREVVDAVYDRTDGIPLHIEELLGALSAEARANGLAIREATVPDTIEDAVLSRLSHRSSEAQAVARAGAVIGRCFVPEVLAGIMDLPVAALDDPLQELVDHHLFYPVGPQGLVDFRHQLLRDAIYRSVPVADRRRYHARAGEFGAALEGQSEIHSSLHFERAGLRRQAFETALVGAREASRLSVHREAFELYRRAVANMPDDVPAAERAAILAAASDEAAAVEENDDSDALGRAAAAAFRAAGDPVKAISVMTQTEVLLRRAGRPTSEWMAAVKPLEAELDGLPDSPEVREARADIAFFLAVGHIDLRELPDAQAQLDRMRALGADLEGLDYEEEWEWKDALIDVLEGDVRSGLDRIAAVATRAVDDVRESIGVTAYRDAGVAALLAMDYPSTERLLRAGLRYADSIEQSYCAHLMSATSAMLEWTAGRWVEAADEAGHAMADRGCRRGAEFARWTLGYVEMGRGDVVAADDDLAQGLAFGIATESIELILPPLWGRAEVAIIAGDPERAAAMCEEALDRSRAVGERLLLVPFVVTGVRAFQAAGRPSDAAEWFDACVAHLGTLPEVATPAIDHGRGLVALSDGATGIARVALEAAVRGWDDKGRIWEATWARLDLANCLMRSNRFADAIALVTDARMTASRLDSSPLADRADALLRLARGRGAEEEPWRPLTAREFAVARLIAEGRTNGEIADTLGIAPKTASSHVEHILQKLGASRRAEIAAWASQVDRSPAPH
jgi:DNA-binding CsgD family transcriptional regulator